MKCFIRDYSNLFMVHAQLMKKKTGLPSQNSINKDDELAAKPPLPLTLVLTPLGTQAQPSQANGQ